MKNTLKIFLAGFLFFSSIPALYCQFYQVYGYQTAEANEKELVYWTSFIPSSNHEYPFFGIRWAGRV